MYSLEYTLKVFQVSKALSMSHTVFFWCYSDFIVVLVLPSTSSLEIVRSANISVLTLNCTSLGSPASSVIWAKENEILNGYVTYRLLTDGQTATYNNFLEVNDVNPNQLIGTYSCRGLNSVGLSNAQFVTIQG